MSTKWHGGKGDKNRITNYERYADNYDNIFINKAVATHDIWGIIGHVDIIEGDTVSFKSIDKEVRVEVIAEAPDKYGEASGNAGNPFHVSRDIFEKKYKPYLKTL